MSKSSRTKMDVCNSRFSDLSLKVHESISRIGIGSSDPHADDFDAVSYLSSVLLSKHPSLGNGNDERTRKELAIAKLFSADGWCRRINEKGFLQGHIAPWELNGLLKTAQALIGNLLHHFETSCLEHCNFSNGASQGFKLREAAPFKKFAGQATVTGPARWLSEQVIKSDPSWYRHLSGAYGSESQWLKTTYGNGLFTVPKNNQVDRAACKEPDMNMYLQKGVGTFIRNRLRSVGIDLNDQTRNQELARIGSIDGSLATLDLSSASDSVSDRLVWTLLPPKLYSYLDMIRSHYTLLDNGSLHRWNLFSTMGNGFTFELESLIFWALAKSVVSHMGLTGDVSIYGDDIIVPVEAATPLMCLLVQVGFKVNTEKSFYTGNFRESCGAFYYKGIDVKPFYIKKPIEDLSSLMLILNRIRGWGQVDGMADPRLFPLWEELSRLVPDIYWGGCDLARDDYLVTPHYPRKRLGRVSKKRSGFDHDFRSLEGGRLVAWLHNGSGEVVESVVSDRFVVRRNLEWSTPTVTFPQECYSSDSPC